MTETETGVRSRTRRAIVAAALDVLAEHSDASLSDVAAAAEVSRTTVHRYFAERADLLSAVTDEIVAKVATAIDRARLDDGAVPEALDRLCREYFELGPALTVLFTGVVEISDEEWTRRLDEPDGGVAAAIARGHRDGTVDPDLAADWIDNLVWALLYTAWTYTRDKDVPRQRSLDLCLRSLRKAIAP